MKNSDNSELTVSVVICTYNRAELLVNGLQTLCEQTIAMSDYEVIVVDNNSQDHTRAVTEDFCQRYSNIRYCLETQQGLSHARNRGWREAKGAYVAYIDDECKVPDQWLKTAIEIIDQISPAVFGGPYYAFYNSKKPYWWKDSYASFEQSLTSRPLRLLEYLRGGNIFLRRQLLEDMHGFSHELGMSAQKIGYCEEVELQRRIRETLPNELIYYDPKLYVFHLVRREKMKFYWILNSSFACGRHTHNVFQKKYAQVAGRTKLKLIVKAFVTLLYLFTDILVGVLRCDRKRYPHLQNYLYENTAQYVGVLGEIFERYTQII